MTAKRLTWKRDLDGSTDVGLRDGVTVDEAMCRLADIESILGKEYDLDQLRELLQAEKDGRLVVLPDNLTIQDLQQQLYVLNNTTYGDEAATYRSGYRNGHRNGRIEVLRHLLGVSYEPREEAEAALSAQKGETPC